MANGRSLGTRLMAALALVLATAAVTAWLVAGAVGPALFHAHLVRNEPTDAGVAAHAEAAFRTASAVALALALVAATAAALAVSLVIARRVGASLAALTAAAGDVSTGRYGARVTDPNMGSEFASLVTTFNQMAGRLEASERLRHRLMSDVAHELRTPVTTLNAYLEGVEDGVTELTPQTVGLLRAQGARLTRLADDLAAVTRAESGELRLNRRPVDVSTLVDAAHLAAHERAAAAGVTLARDVADDVPAVDVDPERLAQVLGNLVDNALRHTKRGDTITLGAGPGPGAAVTMVVRDTGDGIGAEHLPHVFERFYRADTARDRSSGGSGIGLAIVKALVEAHGGRARADSAGAGHGAQFTITLPSA
jgi:signal transduction histidine kinase